MITNSLRARINRNIMYQKTAPDQSNQGLQTQHKVIWAATCYFQRCGILTSVDLDEPVQPPFKLRNSKWCPASNNTHRILKRLAKALIRLRVCAGWSKPLLVAHYTLFEISCRGSVLFSVISFRIVNFRNSSVSRLTCWSVDTSISHVPKYSQDTIVYFLDKRWNAVYEFSRDPKLPLPIPYGGLGVFKLK